MWPNPFRVEFGSRTRFVLIVNTNKSTTPLIPGPPGAVGQDAGGLLTGQRGVAAAGRPGG